jgi:VanZ family protein
VLGLLGVWAFAGWSHAGRKAILLAIVFGAIDEIHQSFVPGRRPGIDDWLFDIFSAAIALYLWPRVQRRRGWGMARSG